MILAAAYDEGFSADINGESAAVYRVNGCQLAVRIPKGSGTVTLRYRTPGLRAACILSGISILAAVLLLLFRRRIPEALNKCAERGAGLLLQTGYLLVLFAVYLLPILALRCRHPVTS